MIKECEGCELDLKNCSMRRTLVFLLNHKPEYDLCPCMECIVKIPCKKNCDELNIYYQNLIWNERQVEAELHVKRM